MPTIRESILETIAANPAASADDLADAIVAAIPDLVALVQGGEEDAQHIASLKSERNRLVSRLATAEQQRDSAVERTAEIERTLRGVVARLTARPDNSQGGRGPA